MKILALEPSINLLKLLSDNMQQYGYQFQGALDIGLAHNVLQMGYQPEIIMINLCFCVHPMISQLEILVQQLNYPYKGIMAILDTESEASCAHARSMGFHGIIVKPLGIKTILTQIELLTGVNSNDQFAFLPLDTRREIRLRIAIEVMLKVVDENNGQFFQEQTITEDISLNGTSILTLLEAKIGSMVSLTLANETESCIGIVRGSFIGADKIRRLNLQVIGKRWQDFYTELTEREQAINKTKNSQEPKQIEVDSGEIFKNRYKIENELGKGGFGIVYKATDLVSTEKVALKLLIESQDMVQHRINQQFFEREIKILSKIQHPNIVSILDSGFSDNGDPFFVMNYIDGIPLDQLIRSESIWPIAKVLNMLKQICPALHTMHLKNIIHRDLKPANIIIENVGKKAILLDLGIAKMVRGNNESSLMQQVTKTGMTVGTLQYISPEQCLDLKLDNGVDIYSLAIMVYQLLTGKMPFKTNTLAELIIAQVQGKPVPMQEVNPNISNAIESVILWGMAKNREQRPKTILEFLQHFEEAVNQSPYLHTGNIDQQEGIEEDPTVFFLPED